MLKITTGILLIFCLQVQAQQATPATLSEKAKAWADSVYQTLGPEERIAQLMVLRLSSIDQKSKKAVFYEKEVAEWILMYNIGGLCLFQGGPVEQATIVNRLQSLARVPLLVSIDGEWGLGMRMPDSVMPLPRQMMLGAIRDSNIIYEYARVVADQCRRFGVHMNFAPVIDINNNPRNPVINDRSFGEDKERVALLGRQYVNGLQDAGVMACLKHFPGHGDVSADSHYELPVINKTMEQLDSLELFPFKKLFEAGASSAMVAHLHIPAIDTSQNRATSLSAANVKELLHKKLGFEGLSFTDALDMKAVSKYFPQGRAALEALKAGNDIMLLPEDVPAAINSISEAIKKGEITQQEIEYHCKRVLSAKYRYGITAGKPVDTKNLSADLNKALPALKKNIAENAITLVKAGNENFFPLVPEADKSCPNAKVAFVGIGLSKENRFAAGLKNEFFTDLFFYDPAATADSGAERIKSEIKSYDLIVLGIHNISRRPQNNFGINGKTASLIAEISALPNTITFLFGNAYAASNVCNASNLAICYEDDTTVHDAALAMLRGSATYKGILPVTVCEGMPFGSYAVPPSRKVAEPLFANTIDSIMYDGIARKAMPGGVVLIAKNGKVVHHKAYGNLSYDFSEPVTTSTVYDVASLTKIFATTLAVMKLYEKKKLGLHRKISHYLPETKRTELGKLSVRKLLLHEAGLPATIPFYKDFFDSSLKPLPGKFSTQPSEDYSLRVGEELYANKSIRADIIKKIIRSPLQTPGKYVYSDNDFILLGEIVERITKMPLERYLELEFYGPLGLESTMFNPLERLTADIIAPTEAQKLFRKNMLRGDVHDPSAALLGGRSGNAGLFSDAYGMYVLMQMMMNEGVYDGRRYLKEKTIEHFTEYGSSVSRRGLGFDKPEKELASDKDPYPALLASSSTYGHLGYTGTCAWADPESGLIYILLSNRVYPSGNDLFNKLSIRRKVFEAAIVAYCGN